MLARLHEVDRSWHNGNDTPNTGKSGDARQYVSPVLHFPVGVKAFGKNAETCDGREYRDNDLQNGQRFVHAENSLFAGNNPATKSCKSQAVDWMIERQAVRIDAIANVLACAIVFCIGFKIAAGI